MSNYFTTALPIILQVWLKGSERTTGKETVSTCQHLATCQLHPASQLDSSNPSLQLSLSHRQTLTLARRRPSSVQSTSRQQIGSLGGSSPTPQR